LKDLNNINLSIAEPRFFGSLGALLPFLTGVFCIPLALGVAPEVAFSDNNLALFSIGLSITSCLLIFIPYLFRWDWRAKYFGMSLFYVGSVGFLGVVPWLGVVLYSSIPLAMRVALFAAYSAAIIWWCRRFIIYYKHLFSEERLWRRIYTEEEDAIYYLQAEDQRLIDRKLKLGQVPPSAVFIFFMASAFLATPFATDIRMTTGVAFIHVFLTLAMVPIVLMCFGLAVRGYLIYYYYPWKLKYETGKDTFVIMAIRNLSSKQPD
jgi:hypothetical protein